MSEYVWEDMILHTINKEEKRICHVRFFHFNAIFRHDDVIKIYPNEVKNKHSYFAGFLVKKLVNTLFW